MNVNLTVPALCLAGLMLAGCGRYAEQNTSELAATASTVAPAATADSDDFVVSSVDMDRATVPDYAQSTAAPAQATSAGYMIAPFPVTGAAACDKFASTARRCLNSQPISDDARKGYERRITDLLHDVRPDPNKPANPWLVASCRGQLGDLDRKFPNCQIRSDVDKSQSAERRKRTTSARRQPHGAY